jgi:hypothetical protein|tara:strand:- start:185 stop:307 length:123 start_codon:yes stop_codon:yes gene_type:complete
VPSAESHFIENGGKLKINMTEVTRKSIVVDNVIIGVKEMI